MKRLSEIVLIDKPSLEGLRFHQLFGTYEPSGERPTKAERLVSFKRAKTVYSAIRIAISSSEAVGWLFMASFARHTMVPTDKSPSPLGMRMHTASYIHPQMSIRKLCVANAGREP